MFSSMFGSNNTIWLKAKQNLPVFLDTLTHNLCLVRVHAFVPREISLLPGQNLSLRFSTSSVQSVQENVENPQETARRQASTNASWSSESSIAGWPHAENSRATLWTYSSSFDSAFSSRPAILRIAISGFSLGKRALAFGLGRPLLSLSSKRRGLVCDGGQAVPSKSSRLPRSGAPAGPREHAGLVSGIHNDPCLHSQTHPGLGSPTRFRELSGLVRARAGSCNSAIFILSVDCRTAEANAIADCRADPCAKRFINMSGKLWSCPMAPDCKPCSKN